MTDEYKQNIVKFKDEVETQILKTVAVLDSTGFVLLPIKTKERIEQQLMAMQVLSRTLGDQIAFF